MPVYVFECDSCTSSWDEMRQGIVPLGASSEGACPACKATGKRVVTAPQFAFPAGRSEDGDIIREAYTERARRIHDATGRKVDVDSEVKAAGQARDMADLAMKRDAREGVKRNRGIKQVESRSKVVRAHAMQKVGRDNFRGDKQGVYKRFGA